jgi:hypothetical protein
LLPGVIDEMAARIWEQLTGRVSGPLSLRFLLQPTVAVTLAIRAGIRDARAGRPAFLATLVGDVGRRLELLRSGWADIGQLFAVAFVLDTLYQIEVLRFFHPLQTLAVAATLAIAPYVAVRGLVTRLVGAFRRRSVR